MPPPTVLRQSHRKGSEREHALHQEGDPLLLVSENLDRLSPGMKHKDQVLLLEVSDADGRALRMRVVGMRVCFGNLRVPGGRTYACILPTFAHSS